MPDNTLPAFMQEAPATSKKTKSGLSVNHDVNSIGTIGKDKNGDPTLTLVIPIVSDPSKLKTSSSGNSKLAATVNGRLDGTSIRVTCSVYIPIPSGKAD